MKRYLPAFAISVALLLFVVWIRGIAKNLFEPELQTATIAPVSVVEGMDKLAVLDEILQSKNDNDPRLDHDFNDLSLGAKLLFREKYIQIPEERRNERGTIVYLLGRNLRTHEDWIFLRGVTLEPPCLSLANCAVKPAPGSDEEATGDEVTLAYPSLVALRQAAQALEKARANRASAMSAQGTATEKEAIELFAAAKHSKTRAVARMAALNQKKYARP